MASPAQLARLLDKKQRASLRTVLNRMAHGADMEEACASKYGLPAADTIRQWARDDDTGVVRASLAHARDTGDKRVAAKSARRVRKLALKAERGTVPAKQARVAMHGHEWLAERLDRDRYGQAQDIKVTVEHRGVIGGSVLGHGAQDVQPGSPQLHSPREQAPRMIEAEAVDVEPDKPAAPEPDVDSAP